MSTCGCTDTNPATPLPPNCNAIPVYAEPVAPDTSPCCMACVFDDLEANWVKPVGEATALLPVCDVTRFRADQCVAVVGTNGKGGVYKIEAVLTDEIELSIYDGTTYDIGGAGTVLGGRVYLLPVCPLTQAQVISLISGSIPSAYTLAVHSSSDTTHGFSLAVVSNQIKLVYSQANFETQVATALTNLGVSYPQMELTDTPITLVASGDMTTSPFNASGSIDFATDFSTNVPAGATHAIIRVMNRLSASDVDPRTTGADAEAECNLEFASNAATAVKNTSNNTEASNNELPNRGHVNTVDTLRYVPLTAGEVAWTFAATASPTPAGANDGADAIVDVYLVGWLIAF